MTAAEATTSEPSAAEPSSPEPAAPEEAAPLAWADLVAQATLGTGRRPQRVVGAVAGASLPAARTAEQSVLAAAAALGAARRVSTTAQHRDDLRAAAGAPADHAPIAPPRAMEVLEVILGQEVVQAVDAGPLVQAWLQRCIDTGHRVAPVVLPRLLHRVLSGEIDTVTVARAIGARGRWLAGQHRAWAVVAQVLLDADPDQLHQRLAGPADRADAASRPAALAALRRQNRPTAAAALADLWPRLTVPERRALLALVTADLGRDDEPWLEAALSDRSTTVAHGAAALLSRLPDSRRAGRMADRLRAIAEIARVRLRRRLVLQRPALPGPEALRDASEHPPGQATVEWWQAQIVRGAPLSTWRDLAGGVEPAIRLLRDDATLLGLLADAAALQRDPAWQTPLLLALLDGVGLGPADLERLTGPAAAQAERQARTARTAAIGRLTASLPMPWDHRTSRALLEWVMTHPEPGPTLAHLRPTMAAGLSTDMTDVLRAHEGYNGADAHQVVQGLTRLRHVLSLRQEITTVFPAPGRDQAAAAHQAPDTSDPSSAPSSDLDQPR